MSWIEKEIQRRTRQSAAASPAPKAPPEPEEARITALWHRFESANEALPAELRLVTAQGVAQGAPTSPPDAPRILVWLVGPNGAALGRAEDAIRYTWPVPSGRRSHNFWIRWDGENARFIVVRRVGRQTVTPPAVYKFDERRIDYIVQCLVTDRRVKIRAVRKKWLWLF